MTPLYDKYRVTDPAGKPLDGSVFVLRYDRDRHALSALLAYAESVAPANPELAADLRREVAAWTPCPTCGRLGVSP